MKEAIGSTWLMGMIITFIAIFSGFLAYSISYTKAFRVKNEIINIIEKNEGYTISNNVMEYMNGRMEENSLSEKDLSATEYKIYKFIKSIGYDYAMNINCDTSKNARAINGYCIKKHCPDYPKTTKTYYSVTTYVHLSLPIANIGIKIPISGQTKTMYYDNTGSGLQSMSCYGV